MMRPEHDSTLKPSSSNNLRLTVCPKNVPLTVSCNTGHAKTSKRPKTGRLLNQVSAVWPSVRRLRSNFHFPQYVEHRELLRVS